MPFSFVTPKKSLLGENALANAREDLLSLGQKALIVTGQKTIKMPAFQQLTALLGDLPYAVFNDIPGEPDDLMVAAGTTVYQQEGCDCIIGIGGGSALDCAKAIAVGAVLPGNICDSAGKEIIADVPPYALIPTTAGTGTEATRYTIITNSKTNAKLLLKGDALLPKLAIVDYSLTMSMPPSLTAYTGMDTLTHAVESYTSKKSTPVSDALAIDAIKRCFESLPKAFEDGSASEARQSMSIAAYEAGVCICNAPVTIVHGMSRPIGAKFHVPHGLSNAMLLAPCLSFAAEGAPERFGQLAREVGLADHDVSDTDAAGMLIDRLQSLTELLKIPSPGEYGIPKSEFFAVAEQMADEALQSGSPGNTRRSVTKDDIVAIYQSLY